MDKLEGLYTNRYLGLGLLTLEMIIEHFQVLVALKYSLNPEGGSWNSSASDFLDGLESAFLISPDSNFHSLFLASCIIISVLLLIYIIFNSHIHQANVSEFTWKTIVILICDHILIGLGFIIMITILLSPHFCNELSELIVDTNVTCWKKDHMIYIELGFLFSAILLILAAGICVILRAERKGVEKIIGKDYFLPGIYKILGVTIVGLFSTIGEPYLGLFFSLALFLYWFVYETYVELHVASIRMGSIFALVWGFLCAEIVRNDSDKGSDMLVYGWFWSFVFGYAVLYLKSLVIIRQDKVISIDK